MMLRKIILALSFTGALSANTGFSFLKIGVSARHAAMGEAAMAMPSDATAAYWNPSGLAFVKHNSAVLTYNRWIEDTRHHFFAADYHTTIGVFAIHYIATGVDGIEQRDIPSDEPTAIFSSHDVALGFSYARLIQEKLAVGITAKYIYERIQSDVSAWGFDLGVSYKPDKILFSAAIVNLGFSNKLISETIKLPLGLKLGASKEVYNVDEHRISAVGEVVQYREEKIKMQMGSEYTYADKIAVRAGYQFAYHAKSWTAGLGMKFSKRFELDYAYSAFSRQLNASHRIGIIFKL